MTSTWHVSYCYDKTYDRTEFGEIILQIDDKRDEDTPQLLAFKTFHLTYKELEYIRRRIANHLPVNPYEVTIISYHRLVEE
jgi:hypothetical protein